MYLGSWKIDDYVPIPVAIHRLSTGQLYQPTSLTYSIYEDGGTTGIVEDVDMTPASPFDGVVGLYLTRKKLTAVAGFEKGNNYTVVIKASVDGVSQIDLHTFQIEAEVDANVLSDKTGLALGAAQTFDLTGSITGNLSGTVGSVTGAVGSVTGNVAGSVASVTGGVTLAVDQAVDVTKIAGAAVSVTTAQLGVNLVNWKGAAAPAMTGDSFARLGAPAGASVSADVAAVKVDTEATLTDTGTTIPALLPTDFATVAVAANKIAATASVSIDAAGLQTIVDGLIAGGLVPGLVLQAGHVETAGTARRFTLSSDFPALANAYPTGTVLTFTDATTGQTYAGRIKGYTAGRVVTMADSFLAAPENGDAVKVWPFFWVPVGF
jgi:hypothetical protein